MARRKQQQQRKAVTKRRRRTNSKKNDNNDVCVSSIVKSNSKQASDAMSTITGNGSTSRPNQKIVMRSRSVRGKIRRRSSTSPIASSTPCAAPAASGAYSTWSDYTATCSTHLPIAAFAVYRPASLFAMLLIAAMLPKNTFSLRWLALSGGFGNFGSFGRIAFRKCSGGVCSWQGVWANDGSIETDLKRAECGDKSSPLTLALAANPESDGPSVANKEETAEKMGNNMEIESSMFWNDSSFHEDLSQQITGTNGVEVEDDSWEESFFELLSMDDQLAGEGAAVYSAIPRGGGMESIDSQSGPKHAGLINLGNTCYLNAQLQCAYHVPYLRKLILDAKDELVEVEVEVEVEEEIIETNEEVKQSSEVANADVATEAPAEDEYRDGVSEEEAIKIDNVENAEMQTDACDKDDETGNRSDNRDSESASEVKVDSEATGVSASDAVNVTPSKKTVIKTEIKPISQALRALQHTFQTLAPSTSGHSSGTTNALVRCLGINPFLQQDGQEFWKLFIPEVDFEKLTQLYSGFFEDYVREIIPAGEQSNGEEDYGYGEEKKDDDELIASDNQSKDKPRERIRVEPFLDLSIPVAEGIGGSVESTLEEMFTQPEVLSVSEGNGWRPEKGAEKVDAFKGSSLKDEGLPSLLQLHLKRFKYDWETGETSKINDPCRFPLELDLSGIISQSGHDQEGSHDKSDAVYDLQSVVIHKGEYGSGHYYSYVRPDIRTNDWYRFDDAFVSRVDYNDVIADAYGGRVKRKRSNSLGAADNHNADKLKRGFFRRMMSFGFGHSNSGREGAFGYGGRTSSAYMLQYVKRSELPKLYLEE